MTDFEYCMPPVPPDLVAHVASWVGYRERAPSAFTRLESPDGSALLVFEFGDAIGVGRPGAAMVQHPCGFFAGIDDLPTATRIAGEQAGVQVSLTLRGALTMTRGGLAELARLVVPAEDLGFARSMRERLEAAPHWPERFAVVTAALRERLRHGSKVPALVAHALRRIDEDHGMLRVATLARELGVGRQHLHRTLANHIGIAPKRYASVRRLALAASIVRTGGYTDLAAVAQAAGYADQAHLNRDVREHAGCTPTAWATALQAPPALAVRAPAD